MASRPEHETSTARRAPRRWRRNALISLALVIALLGVPAWSLGRTLAANTTDPLGVRAVEWARDHGLGGIVNFVERTWYSHHQPPIGGMPKGGIPLAPKVQGAHTSAMRHHRRSARFVAPPSDIVPLVAHPLGGEGVWQPSGRLVHGRAAMWIAYLRPDAVHTSLIAGVAYFDMSRLSAVLHAGTKVPGGGPWIHGPRIVPADYPFVVAAFNGAFRLDNSRGGYYAEGRTVKGLVPGRASLVTYANGRVDVGLWGRDDAMSPAVMAVRQNLQLIVDHRALVPHLADANNQLWGGTLGNRVYVWRSGLGIDAHGNVIYAGGPGLNVATLAEMLRRAGCVRAMELDINNSWVTLTTFASDGHGGLQGTNMLRSMVRSRQGYLSNSTKDFIELDARH